MKDIVNPPHYWAGKLACTLFGILEFKGQLKIYRYKLLVLNDNRFIKKLIIL